MAGAIDILRVKLKPARFPGMSPLMAAIVGYILGESYTKPEIGEIMVGEGDNLVYIRRSGAVGFEGIQSLEDLKLGLEREIKELDRQISERRRAAALARSLAEKLEAQKAICELEVACEKKKPRLFPIPRRD